MRRAARRDHAEPDVVDVFTSHGWSVLKISVAHGPDFFAAKKQQFFWKDQNGTYHYDVRPVTVAVECKTGTRKLRPGQQTFRETWAGEYVVLRTADEALEFVREGR